ncbi:MAG: class I SAM-dependent methyltransferase [Planctomycetales bacterium]|nr:class I SAM-dependent methyltransferase [Planctomycetales bacterium]
MTVEDLLITDRFPRAAKYHPNWILAGSSGGANPLWLTEWLSEALTLEPGMRVLDLGCGRALSSIFLQREFGVQVWATDLWFSASENSQRVRESEVQNDVFPIRADARALPFSEEFFDVVVGIDSFMYFGTDDLYLNYLARFVKPNGQIGIALAGFEHEMDGEVPEHLADWWAAENPYCLHSAGWWRRHWERSKILNVEVADTLPGGWRLWRDWVKLIAPDNEFESQTLDADAGRNLAYVRAVGRRRAETPLFDPVMSIPSAYTSQPLLRDVG